METAQMSMKSRMDKTNIKYSNKGILKGKEIELTTSTQNHTSHKEDVAHKKGKECILFDATNIQFKARQN